ncbi:hypothetical protein MKUB_30030 [Mycobacterium kubicae]|uniref:Multi-ubiquitin domain-containing protein n=1 Tax=Mycobacterium kubicae TaxID=120959 RepID=A0AAX1J9E8_9MYCO|nr:hypothetical protein [Mycobacterium kubicae]ORV98913.1 hypothetical protein AWC13_11965 [Mycobacterium kubicae]QNI09936.1 hypothetical protein GAN18_00680 [Mycobacterium kubicae]QPI38133.1 hypothetical protein I2456_00640 [Mycobacterium kubicae]GFG65513.1 hypothetical protein MKUB_30030 [Mycobacterium kubicae]
MREQIGDTVMTDIRVEIDGVTHPVNDDDFEAAALVRLAGRDPADYDLFIVDKHGVETHVKDKQIVNPRDRQRFRTRRKVRFTIDGERHSTWDDDQTAADLMRLAGVDPARYDLARVNGANGPQTFTADQIVTISDGDEFVTARRAGPVA